jgi:trimeric autotransporter adhesin
MIPLLAALLAQVSPPPPSGDDFARSIGVVTHIDARRRPWGDADALLAQLRYLGIRTVRDGAPQASSLPVFIRLARAGIGFNLFESSVYDPASPGVLNPAADVARAHALADAVPDSVLSLEGANEYSSHDFRWAGTSSRHNLAWGPVTAVALRDAMRADAKLARTMLVAPSAIELAALPPMGAPVDAANAHVYGRAGQQLQDPLTASIRYAAASAPGKPVYVTETGVSSAGYAQPDFSVADEADQAVIVVNALLGSYRAGAKRTFVYELIDEPYLDDAQERSFGLFRADGTPKPAATAVRNLLRGLSGDPAGRRTPPPAYRLSGLPPTASAMLFAKAGGRFGLVLWNGRAPLFDGRAKRAPVVSRVRLDLPAPARTVAITDVLRGISRPGPDGPGPVAIDLAAGPVIVELVATGRTDR